MISAQIAAAMSGSQETSKLCMMHPVSKQLVSPCMQASVVELVKDIPVLPRRARETTANELLCRSRNTSLSTDGTM